MFIKQTTIANMLIADANAMVVLINCGNKVYFVITKKMNGMSAIVPTLNDIAREIKIIEIFVVK